MIFTYNYTSRGTQVLLGILGILAAGFATSAIIFIDASIWQGSYEYQLTQSTPTYPFVPIHNSAGPVIFTSVAIPIAIGVLVSRALSSRKRGNVLAGLSVVAGMAAFFFVDLAIVTYILNN